MYLIEQLFNEIIKANTISEDDKIGFEILLQYPLNAKCTCAYCKAINIPKEKITSLIEINGKRLIKCPRDYIKDYHYSYFDLYTLFKNFNTPIDLNREPYKLIEIFLFLDNLIKTIQNNEINKQNRKLNRGTKINYKR